MYVFAINPLGIVEHLYWGPVLPESEDLTYLYSFNVEMTFETVPATADEEGLRVTLSARGEVRRIGYRCNRAVIFVSDQYHETEPFRFKPGYEHRRVNLTLLYGDRWSPVGTDDPVTASSDWIDAMSGAPPAVPPPVVPAIERPPRPPGPFASSAFLGASLTCSWCTSTAY